MILGVICPAYTSWCVCKKICTALML